MQRQISVEVQKRAAYEVIVNKLSKASVARMLNISERSVGRYADKFVSEVERESFSGVDEVMNLIKQRIVLTKSGKVKNRPSKIAVEAFIKSKGDKSEFEQMLESSLSKKAIQHGYYRAKAYLG